jgi:hypothetical protein
MEVTKIADGKLTYEFIDKTSKALKDATEMGIIQTIMATNMAIQPCIVIMGGTKREIYVLCVLVHIHECIQCAVFF